MVWNGRMFLNVLCVAAELRCGAGNPFCWLELAGVAQAQSCGLEKQLHTYEGDWYLPR